MNKNEEIQVAVVYKDGLLHPLNQLGLEENQQYSATLRKGRQLPPGMSGKALASLIGQISPEDLAIMEEASNDCRKIDPDGW